MPLSLKKSLVVFASSIETLLATLKLMEGKKLIVVNKCFKTPSQVVPDAATHPAHLQENHNPLYADFSP